MVGEPATCLEATVSESALGTVANTVPSAVTLLPLHYLPAATFGRQLSVYTAWSDASAVYKALAEWARGVRQRTLWRRFG